MTKTELRKLAREMGLVIATRRIPKTVLKKRLTASLKKPLVLTKEDLAKEVGVTPYELASLLKRTNLVKQTRAQLKANRLRKSQDELVERLQTFLKGRTTKPLYKESPSLYAQAHRLFGSWDKALEVAGFVELPQVDPDPSEASSQWIEENALDVRGVSSAKIRRSLPRPQDLPPQMQRLLQEIISMDEQISRIHELAAGLVA
jgi:hypothetical protein